jgi:hypothetical protein
MVHPTESDLQALADGELSATRQAPVLRHVETCAACADRLRRLAGEEAAIAASLRLLDHSVPELSVATVLERARRRPSLRRPLMAAGLSALFAAAAAAAVIPGSPLNLYLGRVVGGWRQAPPTVTPRPAQPDHPQPRGVAFVPGPEVEIVFGRSQPGGAIRLSLGASPTVRVTGTDPSASYALEPARVTVDNPSADGTYEIQIPRTLRHARVRVEGRVVFEKTGDTVSTESSPDDRGTYRLPFREGDAKGSGSR